MKSPRRPTTRPAQPRKNLAPRDSSAEFEKLLKTTSVIQHYSLRLYITGTTARSTQAVANIRSLCEEYLQGRYDLEVVDIYQKPAEAVDEQIIAAPTLIKKTPMPPRRMIGNLADRDKILAGLDLRDAPKGKKTKWSLV